MRLVALLALPSVRLVNLVGKDRLSYPTSTSYTTTAFQLVHFDLWTSPIVSFSGYKYYLVVLDDYSHYSWTFPLRNKSDTCATIQRFYQFVLTQFHVSIQCLQCDNGGEFLTNALRDFFSQRGTCFRLSCPHTSPQNGKAERLIRTTNDIVRSLLLQASLPPPFWVEALHTATHLLNLRPCRAISFSTPHYLLYGVHPSYDHLRIFGCLCFPNLYATKDHKLAPRSARCIFIGYPREHKGYRCFDLKTRRVIISRNVIFDETNFPYFSPAAYSEPCAEDPVQTTSATPIPLESRAAPTSYPATTPTSPSHPPIQPTDPPSPDAPCSGPPRSTSPAEPRADAVPSQSPRTDSPQTASPSTHTPSPPTTSPVPTNPAPPPLPPKAIPVQAPHNPHRMITRAKSGYFMPKQDFSLHTHTNTISPIPPTYCSALKDPNWHAAMLDEYNALMRNDTWSLVSRPAGVNMVTDKWIFRHKFNPDGSLARYKARWVVRGFTQQHGLDYGETFSPVVKPPFSVLPPCSHGPFTSWMSKNAFLHSELLETVYCEQPAGFLDSTHPSHLSFAQISLWPQTSSSHLVSSLYHLHHFHWFFGLQE